MRRVLVVGAVLAGLLGMPGVANPQEPGGASIAVTIESAAANWPPVVVTLTNDGDEDLGPAPPPEWGSEPFFVSLSEGGIPVGPEFLTAPPNAGDDNSDGILNVGEVWTWTFYPSCSGDFCTIVATGYAVTSSDLVVTYPEDQEARDSVFVDLLPDGRPADSVGVVDRTQGRWYLRDAFAEETTSFYFGNPFDMPFMGDWNCDGVDTPGLYRQADGYVYLRNSNTQGLADIGFYFGNPGDVPLAGDFNADGCDTVSIYRTSEARIYIANDLGSNDGGLGAADYWFDFGNVGDKPFTADFDDNRQDTVGLHRESTGLVYYRNTLTTGVADDQFVFGDPGDQIIAGRWAQNPTRGPDTVGIFRPANGTFSLRFTNTQGVADVEFPYGNVTMTGVAGTFGALPGGDPSPPGAGD